MNETIIAYEPQIRLAFFLTVFAVMAALEVWRPRRTRHAMPKATRWFANLGVVAINTVALRIIFPAGAVGMAALAHERGWGILHIYGAPDWFAIIVSVVFLDFAIYMQHVMFHAVPVLWRLHRVHHADLDFDVTTGARFHPIEIILSMLIKLSVIAVTGAPAMAVLIFEILLNATAMFNHSNFRIGDRLDGALRLAIVTPDMHRVHHSVESLEANSNFGFNLSIWDRLFGTYIPAPAKGHEDMDIGVKRLMDARFNTLGRMLIQPFTGQASDYPINKRGF